MGSVSSKSEGSSGSSSSATCPALPTPLDDADKAIGDLTVHQFFNIFGGACGALAIILSVSLLLTHAFNVRNAAEQLNIMRIITIIPVFCILAWVNINIGQGAIYLDPWMDFYESMCLCTFFLLVETYIHPDPNEQHSFMAALPLKDRRGKKVIGNSSSGLYKRARIAVFQSMPVLFILAILTDIFQAAGRFCINSNSPKFAHIWLNVISFLSTGTAVVSAIRFTFLLRPEMKGRALMKQLLAFKLIVGLNSIQELGFSIAAAQVHPTNTLSYNDIAIGLPNLVLLVELLGISAFFWKAYSVGPYLAHGQFAQSQQTEMNPVMAVLRAFNPVTVMRAMIAAFTGRRTSEKIYYSPNANHQAQINQQQGMPLTTTGPMNHPATGAPLEPFQPRRYSDASTGSHSPAKPVAYSPPHGAPGPYAQPPEYDSGAYTQGYAGGPRPDGRY